MSMMTYFVKDTFSLELEEVRKSELHWKYLKEFRVQTSVLELKDREVSRAAIRFMDGENEAIYMEIEDLYANEKEMNLVATCEFLEGAGFRLEIPGKGLIRANRFDFNSSVDSYTESKMRAVAYFVTMILLGGSFTSIVIEESIVQTFDELAERTFRELMFKKSLTCDGVTYLRADDPSDVIWA